VLGRKMDKVDVINAKNWSSIDKAMCDAFYERYKSELDEYDGFIVTHSPCFSMLYEKWRKPIICVASTRYEHPFSADRKAWENFNSFLRTKIDEGVLIPVANNKYDADYCSLFTQREWRVIPSLCDYTNAPYTGTRDESLLVSKYHEVPPIRGLIRKDREFKPSLFSRAARKLGYSMGRRGHSWQEIARFRSVVYIPYNASIMSIFEMYTSSIPMYFPSSSLLAELYKLGSIPGILSELSFNQVRGMAPGSVIPCGPMDPNNYVDEEAMMEWVAKSDFYDADNMAGLVYFNSFDELQHLMQNTDLGRVRRTMLEHNLVRKQRTHSAWTDLLATVNAKL
jgi:hypothetical protein